LLLPTERAEALTAMLGPVVDGANVRWLTAREIVDHLAAGGDGVGILPTGSATPSIRSVPSGGVDLVRGIGDAKASPLVQRVWWSWQDERLSPFVEKLIARVNTTPPSITRLLITGDVIPARCVYAKHRDLNDYTAAFVEVGDALYAADITVGSLDAAISDAGTPTGCEQTFNLLAPPRSVEGLAAAGYDVITVATNHAKDCGSAGIICKNESFLDTLANLRGAGIAPVGGGTDLASARAPVVIERNGVRFAFLGYDDVSSGAFGATAKEPGTAPLSVANLYEDIDAAKRVADVVIVLPQWGVEYALVPNSRQTELARVAIEAGATIVAGNHPHVVQGVEWFEIGFAAYALGNFVFDQDWSVETQQGAVLEATFHGKRLAGVRLVPVRIRNMYQPTWASGTEARSILDRMRRSSEAIASSPK
jgi:poly-gamma-glutamate synthesis protein (capsule biosynthesis protein)